MTESVTPRMTREEYLEAIRSGRATKVQAATWREVLDHINATVPMPETPANNPWLTRLWEKLEPSGVEVVVSWGPDDAP